MPDIIIHPIKGITPKRLKLVLQKIRRGAPTIAAQVTKILGAKAEVYLGSTWEHLTPPSRQSIKNYTGAYAFLVKTDFKLRLFKGKKIREATEAIRVWLDRQLPAGYDAIAYGVANRYAEFVEPPNK
jgi:hypothetical protein